MVLGIRVVRGPDWNLADKDGGPDHVGTVVKKFGADCLEVMWDMGEKTLVRAGQDGKYDLRLIDSAPLGICHTGIGCNNCGEACIAGTRWKCSTCTNVSICTPCYFDKSHEAAHEFLRVDYPGAKPVKQPLRSKSERKKAMGIYPNAEVSRGMSWEYAEQDGGSRKVGLVEDLVNFGQDLSQRNAVRVRWPNKYTGIYRVGYKGNVDLICKKAAPGGEYFPGHLAIVDQALMRMGSTQVQVLKVGDTVCVDVTKTELRQLQLGRHAWNTRMEDLCGEIGVIKAITIEGDVEVKFKDKVVALDKGAIAKVPQHKEGDSVFVIDSMEKIQLLQHKRGGWDEKMTEVIGKIGKIMAIDYEGDVGVRFGEIGFIFHPSCLLPFGDKKDDPVISKEAALQEAKTDAHPAPKPAAPAPAPSVTMVETVDENLDYTQMFAGLMMLQEKGAAKPTTEEKLVQAVVQGKPEEAKKLLKGKSSLKNMKHKKIPILCIAAHRGHVTVMQALLDAGSDINVQDEKQNTPLYVATMAEKEDAVKFLVEQGAIVNVPNVNKRTPLHMAANKKMATMVKFLLEAGANVNAQDASGNPPMFDAISSGHDETANLIINHPRAAVWLKNNRKFNSITYACLKAHAYSIDKLITREPRLVKAKETTAQLGYYPIHIAAANNHLNEANVLIIKGRCDVNVKNEHSVTPIHLAASEGYYDMVKLLLTHDAEWTVKDSEGNTPLHLVLLAKRTDAPRQFLGMRNVAEDNERIKIASLLIQHGASSKEKNKQDKTPLEACQSDRMRNAVITYAEHNKPTAPEPRQSRPKTAKAEQQMFKSSTQRCHKCSDLVADVRFLPCRDLIACHKCCFKFKRCPVCQKEISKRVDKDNQPLTGEACVVS